MFHTTIVNPKTNRTNNVRCWKIEPRQAISELGQLGVKAYSWKLLEEPEAVEDMEAEQYGDQASNNFALSVFENALDWRLGLAVHNFIRGFVKLRKLPKPFDVAVNHKGDIFIVTGVTKTVIEVK